MLPFALWFFFKQGYNLKAREENEPIIPSKRLIKPKKDKAQKRIESIMQNIDAYDGTSSNQKEIK